MQHHFISRKCTHSVRYSCYGQHICFQLYRPCAMATTGYYGLHGTIPTTIISKYFSHRTGWLRQYINALASCFGRLYSEYMFISVPEMICKITWMSDFNCIHVWSLLRGTSYKKDVVESLLFTLFINLSFFNITLPNNPSFCNAFMNSSITCHIILVKMIKLAHKYMWIMLLCHVSSDKNEISS